MHEDRLVAERELARIGLPDFWRGEAVATVEALMARARSAKDRRWADQTARLRKAEAILHKLHGNDWDASAALIEDYYRLYPDKKR